MSKVIEREMKAAEKAFKSAIERRSKIGEKHFAVVVLPEMKRRIGKCYVYRNSDGRGETWSLYRKIIGVKDESYLVLDVSKRPSGIAQIEIHQDHVGSLPEMSSGWEPIAPEDCHRQTKPIIDDVVRAHREQP